MERNRETRRGSILGSNGFKRSRNRANSLRDSPDEDGRVELQESVSLRGRVKKGRNSRERERGFRDRDLRRHSKRRRRADDETSEESFNDDGDEDEENIATTASAGRLFPPPSGSVPDHHHRKSFPPGFSSSSSSSKILRASPIWKPGDGVISSSVPRKARSAITKRSHDWNSSSSNNINVCAGSVGGGTEQIFRQASISPTRQSGAVSTSTLSQAAPKSPPSSSSNSFFIKKPKTNGNNAGPNLKPPKSAPSKQNSSNREDLEIEIAEVLYGLMTQSHGSSSKESSRSNGDSKSSPISTSGHTQIVALKRKRLRQVEENSGHGDRPDPNPEKVVEMHQAPKGPERISGENGFEVRGNLVNSQEQPTEAIAEEEITESTTEKESCVVKKEDKLCNDSGSTATALSSVTNITSKSKEFEVDIIEREHKFEIDVMALPPEEQSSPESQKSILSTVDAESKPADKENEEEEKSAKGHRSNLAAEESKSKEESDLQFDLVKAERNENKFQQQQEMLIETNKEVKPGQPESSSGLPLPMASWPGGLPPMGYMAPPLQEAVSMDGPTVAPLIQPIFTQPRPKRCATHSYIARNIHCMQQLMKMNSFWQAAAGPTSLFWSLPCDPIVMSTDPAGNVAGKGLHNDNAQGKGNSVATNPNHGVNDKSSQNATSSDSARKKQQIQIQQALPTVAPSNLLGPTFIFPYQQQPAVAASASARPNSTKPLSTTGGSASSNPSSSAGAATTVMNFNYPSMPANGTQYLAILQNNRYPFPMPPVGPPPNYRGPPAQAMPFFNGSFYPSQMIHPSQIQHHQKTPPTQQSHNNLSGQQPRSQSSAGPGSTNNPTQKSQQSSQQSLPSNNNQHGHLSRLGREDSPTTTTDSSRGSRAPVNMYGTNFTLPIHPLTMMTQSSNQSEKSPQQPQQFAMSFGTINPGIDVASMAQNHAIFQTFPEPTRQNIQNMMVAAAAAAQSAHNNNNNSFRISQDDKSGAGDSSTNDAERKNSSSKAQNGLRQQSIAFSRSDMADPPVFESLGQASNAVTRTSHPIMNNAAGSINISKVNHHSQGQLQQQQMAISRCKTQVSSNGPVFTEHLKSNMLQNLAQNNISPSQSHQWKNTSRTPTSQAASSLASSTALKNHNSRPATQTQNKMSFGANPKPKTTNSQGQAPMSPTNSSVSKGSSRTTSSNSTNTKTGQSPIIPAEQQKNLPSILGNPNAVKNQMQPQLFFSNPYSLVQAPHSTISSSITSGLNGFYMQQRGSDQHQHHGPLNSTSTNDPAKAFAAATSNVKGGESSSQGMMHAAQFGRPGGGTLLPVGFSYVHPVPAAVRVKPTEQKQPAGNGNLHAWQPDKR